MHNFDIITYISLAILGVANIYFLLRKGGLQGLEQSNSILRKLIEDQGLEIKGIRTRMHDAENGLTAVGIKAEYLEKLINVALVEYFSQYPNAAEAAKIVMVKSAAKGEEMIKK
jgi:hypothetical protein